MILPPLWRPRRLLVLCLCCAGLPGCGPRGETLLPVSGKVRFGGKPLAAGTVVFHADRAAGNGTPHEPRGEISPEGVYHLTTAGRPGAPAGRYKVTVLAVKEAANPTDPYAEPKWLVPPRYVRPEDTPLSVEVSDQPAPGAYDLALSR
jgi:hypothetical protein